MTKSLKTFVVLTGLVGLAACDSNGDQIVRPDIPVAPMQAETSLTFSEITADFDTLSPIIDAEPVLLLSELPKSSTASYSGQFTGDLGIAGTSTNGNVAGTVELTLDFETPSNSIGSIGNLRSPTIDDIDGQIDFLVRDYTSEGDLETNRAIILGGYSGQLTVSDPDFAAQPSGNASGLLFGGATGANADRIFMALSQPVETPTDYTFTGALVAD